MKIFGWHDRTQSFSWEYQVPHSLAEKDAVRRLKAFYPTEPLPFFPEVKSPEKLHNYLTALLKARSIRFSKQDIGRRTVPGTRIRAQHTRITVDVEAYEKQLKQAGELLRSCSAGCSASTGCS